MAGLIWGLHMEVDNVLVLERPERVLGLADVVRVNPARGARHVDHFEPGVEAEAFGKVHRRDDGAFEPVLFLERGHIRPPALSPEPDAVRRALAALHPSLVHRMGGEYIK